MEKHERERVTKQLAASRERLLNLVDGLTPEQWTFRPAEDRWSICDCVEHVTLVEHRLFGLIGKRLEGSPETGNEERPNHPEDDAVASAVPDRSTRRQAPEPARPTGRWSDTNELLAEFEKARERTVRFTEATDADLRNYFAPHPAFGDLDCYQWLIVMSLHGERHALQIEEIKADPAYPR
jgi:DinB superfamily